LKKLQVHSTEVVDSVGVLLAGQRGVAGIYRDVETGREVVLEQDGVLPAACDGRVAVYVLRPATWGELNQTRFDHAA